MSLDGFATDCEAETSQNPDWIMLRAAMFHEWSIECRFA